MYKYIHKHTQFFLFLSQSKKWQLRRKLTPNSLLLGTSAAGVKFSFQQSTWSAWKNTKHMTYPHDNLFIDWHQEHALLYFRIDPQPVWIVTAPLKPIALWQYTSSENLYTSAGSKNSITNYNLKTYKMKLKEEWSETVWLSGKMKWKKVIVLERACR